MKRTLNLAVVIGFVAIGGAAPSSGQEAAIVGTNAEIQRIEEQYRVAKLQKDVAALDQLLDRAFAETNQNGNTRDKAETIALWRDFHIQSLRTDTSTIRVSGDAANVTGAQTEVNGTGTDRMLFTRVYVKRENGWLLLSSSQFRIPGFRLTAR